MNEPAVFPPPPADAVLRALLDAHAPLRPAPLCPEIRVFHATSLVAIWEAAERAAGDVLPSPFWAYPWPAGAALARFILDHGDVFANRRVLDFGCGGGIASLAAARAGAADVVANDVDPWALAVARHAAAAQDPPLIITTCALDFTRQSSDGHRRHDHGRAARQRADRPASEPDRAAAAARTARSSRVTGLGTAAPHDRSGDVAGFDIVLCADLGYERSIADAQRAVLERARAAGARVFVADAGRAYFSPHGLVQLAAHELDVPEDLEGVTRRIAIVYELVG